MFVKLKDLCLLEKGSQIDTETLDDSKPYPYLNGGIKESGYYESFNTNDAAVTISEGGASCGFVNYRQDKFWCGCHCYKLTKTKVLAKYLYFVLKANQERIMSLRTGVAMPNIKKSCLMDFQLDISFDKQVQISIIKEFDSIELLLKEEKNALISFDEMIKSRFIEMFGACQTWKNLEDVTSKITDGSHNPPKGIAYSKYIMLSSQNVFDELDLSDVRYLSEADYLFENKRTHIEEDDVLLTIVGTIGRTHVVKNSEKFVFQRSVGVIKPNHQYIKGRYLSEYLKSTDATNQIEVSGHGVAQKGIYLGNLKKLLIKVPSMEMQNSFVEFMELIDKLKFNAQKRIELYQELLNKKMDEYFN